MQKASKANNYHYNKQLQFRARELRNSMTKAECCLWKYILNKRKMHAYQFTRQRPVLNYIVDFMCKELMLIIEVDGVSHQFNDNEIKDRKRQTQLEKIGFTVLRFQDSDVLNSIGDVSATIENFIKQSKSYSPPLSPLYGDTNISSNNKTSKQLQKNSRIDFVLILFLATYHKAVCQQKRVKLKSDTYFPL